MSCDALHINAILDTNKGVFFFSKVGCPYCERLEKELEDRNIPYAKHVLDPNDTNYETVAQCLKTRACMKTFPMLFFGATKIGGYSDFRTLCMTNELGKKLNEIGIRFEDDF